MKSERAALLARSDLVGPGLRGALSDLTDEWLTRLIGDHPDVALVGVGGLGRRELAPGSDLDLLLLHRAGTDVDALAQQCWYPIWDTGVGLDHSVRTVDEAIATADDDLKVALGLLDARHVAGDEALTSELRSRWLQRWRTRAGRRLPELRAVVEARAETSGEVAFLLEPDLKEARGGIRDVQAVRAVAATQAVDAPVARIREAYQVLLDVRGELHRRTGRGGDRLLLQEQDALAAALGYPDADALMAAVSGAGRAISYALDVTWHRVDRWSATSTRRRWSGLRGRPTSVRRPLADDVVEQDGEVVLARDAEPATDPALVLRVARAAAAASLPVAEHALRRLAAESPPLPEPWPAVARDDLVAVFSGGSWAVRVLEDLDQAGLLVRLLPEWARVRSKPQRNAYHRFTVDRHLIETAVNAATLARGVSRPDLLVLGALLHDIGKGWPGDHTEEGMTLVAEIGPRLGLVPDDTETLVLLVEHHLLLPDTATRRDLGDPATVQLVADAVGRRDRLQLLHGLTQADSLATGSAAWSDWKAGLVAELVSRTEAVLSGDGAPEQRAATPRQEELAAAGVYALDVDGDVVTVAAPNRPGVLAAAAGVLALHRLDVRAARVWSHDTTALSEFTVVPRFGTAPDWRVVREELRLALEGAFPVRERLASRQQSYDASRRHAPSAPVVSVLDDASAAATVVEVRAPDRIGLLHALTSALQDAGLDVQTALVSTLGADVVDAFYVVDAQGKKLTDEAARQRVAAAVTAAITAA